MRYKLLFLLGIVAVHGVLAAGLTSEASAPAPRGVATTCEKPYEPPLRYSPPLELLAYVAAAPAAPSEVLQP